MVKVKLCFSASCWDLSSRLTIQHLDPGCDATVAGLGNLSNSSPSDAAQGSPPIWLCASVMLSLLQYHTFVTLYY